MKAHVSEHYITELQHKQQIEQFNDKIFELAQSNEEAWTNAMVLYEQYVQRGISKETLRVALDATHEAKAMLAETTKQREAYERGYLTFRKLLSASDKRIPLSGIVDYIEKIVVDAGREIVVKWVIPQ